MIDVVKDLEERVQILTKVSDGFSDMELTDQLDYYRKFVDFTESLKPLYAKLLVKDKQPQQFFIKL